TVTARARHSNTYAEFPEEPLQQPQLAPQLLYPRPIHLTRPPTHTRLHRLCDAHAWAQSTAEVPAARLHPAIQRPQMKCCVTLKPVLQAEQQSRVNPCQASGIYYEIER